MSLSLAVPSQEPTRHPPAFMHTVRPSVLSTAGVPSAPPSQLAGVVGKQQPNRSAKLQPCCSPTPAPQPGPQGWGGSEWNRQVVDKRSAKVRRSAFGSQQDYGVRMRGCSPSGPFRYSSRTGKVTCIPVFSSVLLRRFTWCETSQAPAIVRNYVLPYAIYNGFG